MKVAFVGNRLKLGGISEVIKNRNNGEAIFVEENWNIRNQENELLRLCSGADFMLIDTDQYLNDAPDIIDTLKKVYRATKAKPILYIPTTNPKNELIKNAVANQMKFFVNSSLTLSEQKDQFEKNILGYYEANKMPDIEAVEKEVIEETKTLNEFVVELYDAKQREDKKEKTVIIRKRKTSEILLDAIGSVIRLIANIIITILVAIAVLALSYKEPREAIFDILLATWKEFVSML